jgi:hypothetical protein
MMPVAAALAMNRNSTNDDDLDWKWKRALPAWLLSLAVHFAAAVAGSLLVGGQRPEAPREEFDRQAEIVLVERAAKKTNYFADASSGTSTREDVAIPGGAPGLAALSSDPPLLPGISLPQLPAAPPGADGIVAAPQLGRGFGRPRFSTPQDEAAILAADAAIPREPVPTGPTAQLALFGLPAAEGRSFVFVIDRSASMGSDGLGAIQAAAKELSARIDRLSAEQTFQVVAYNQSVAYLGGRELIPASAENQQKLVRFIADLAAYGQTEHMRGLLAALRLKPEVIFLLTDGGDPQLDAGELRLIREQTAGRTTIHCVQFGRGPRSDSAGFLARLAAESRGSYTYVDMNAR